MKEVFRFIRFIDPIIKEAYFNFPKFHVIIYYPDFVRLYGYLDGTDVEIPEMIYKYIVKQFYDRTNKKDAFLDQIFLYNIYRVNI